MKTYAEIMGHKPIDWEKYLQAMVNCEELPEEIEDIEEKASRWDTDPTANLSSEIPRDQMSAPYDAQLQSLAMTFGANIRFGDYSIALETIAKIKKRGDEILEEMEAKKPKYFMWSGVYSGNSLIFWREGKAGYTSDIDKAHRFTYEEAKSIQEGHHYQHQIIACEHIEQVSTRQVHADNFDRSLLGKEATNG